jgi:hypothetical protein
MIAWRSQGEGSRAHLSAKLEACPARARAVLDEMSPVSGGALARLFGFWGALDDALDAWVEVNPEWEELVRESMRGTRGARRARAERMLERAACRRPAPPEVCARRDRQRRRFFEANHRLDADLSPYLDWEAKRACYGLRLEQIGRRYLELEAAGQIELLLWREAVAAHLERQLEALESSARSPSAW